MMRANARDAHREGIAMTKLLNVKDRDLRAELGDRMETLLAKMSDRERTAGGDLNLMGWLLEADALYEMLDPALHEPEGLQRARLFKALRSIEWRFNIVLAVLLATAVGALVWIVSGIHVGMLSWVSFICGGLLGTAVGDIILNLRRKL